MSEISLNSWTLWAGDYSKLVNILSLFWADEYSGLVCTCLILQSSLWEWVPLSWNRSFYHCSSWSMFCFNYIIFTKKFRSKYSCLLLKLLETSILLVASLQCTSANSANLVLHFEFFLSFVSSHLLRSHWNRRFSTL